MRVLVLLLVSSSLCRAQFGAPDAQVDDEIISMLDDSSTASLSDLETVTETMGMDAMASFAEFQKTHSKKYADKDEHDKRFGIWKDNLDFVQKWNADSSNSFEVGMNEFADLSDEEFANTYLNPQMHEEYQQSETFMA